MSATISSVPLLRPGHLWAPWTPLPRPLDRAGVTFWYSGRPAIFQMARAVGLTPGDRVLAPAYSCGSEIDALLRAGLEVDHYRVHADLTPDLDHLAALSSVPARALYVTHYFGFAQPMAELLGLAQAKGLLLLEDNAHGLYSSDASGRPLGTIGDAGIFSFTKSLAIPDGGALILNRAPAREPPRARRPGARAMAGRVKYMVGETLAIARAPGSPPVPANGPAPGPPPMELMRLRPERAGWGMSPGAWHLLTRTPHPQIFRRRRENFSCLAGAFEPGAGIRPLFSRLPDGCCPNFFPVLADDPVPLHRHLLAHGVQTKRTWSYFHDAYPADRFEFESRLKRCVIALPVHQDLGPEHMRRIADVLARWPRASRAPVGAPRGAGVRAGS